MEKEFIELNSKLDKIFERREKIIKEKMSSEFSDNLNEIKLNDILKEKVKLEKKEIKKKEINLKINVVKENESLTKKFCIPSHYIWIEVKKEKISIDEGIEENIDVESFLEYLQTNSNFEILNIKLDYFNVETYEFLLRLSKCRCQIEESSISENINTSLKMFEYIESVELEKFKINEKNIDYLWGFFINLY